MADSLMVPFSTVLAKMNLVEYRCTDPLHVHRGAVQYMQAVPYRGHKVSITLDGQTFDVRIDDDPATVRMDLTKEKLTEYVEFKTK